MKTSDFDFDLPASFIAQNPLVPRDSSKMLVVARDNNLHSHFFDLPLYLRSGDVLVVNRSRVIPARILFDYCGRELEIFVLKKLDDCLFNVMVRPGKLFKVGAVFENGTYSVSVLEVLDDGTRVVRFSNDHVLEDFGSTPLPPYISKSTASDDQYQTVYAKDAGSVAAPTAGLHFTDRLIEELVAMGVIIVEVLLHVGRGTFLPVTSDDLSEHKMHSEFCELSDDACKVLNLAKQEGRRVIAVGTTSVRVLESGFVDGYFRPFKGDTDIFIHPGSYVWKACDGLITNFHLPKSTLLMLVASFLEHKGKENGRDAVMDLYDIAKKEGYRFYSFGDCMLII